MASEAVSDFVDHPTTQGLKNLKRDELLELARHYNLEYIKASLRKPEMVRKIAEYCVDEDIFHVDAIAQFPDPYAKKPMSETEARIKIMQLEI